MESISQYIKSIINLHNQHRKNNNTLTDIKVRGPLVNAFLDTHAREKAKEMREDFDDCGDNTTLTDGYDEDEYFLENQSSPTGFCRDRLCFLLGHAILGRSQTTL